MSLVADWATTAALLAVLLAEGIRRLPAGAIVLRRTLRGNWRIVHGPTARTEWRLVSIWAPFFEHLVVQARSPAELLTAIDDDGRGEIARRLPSRLTTASLRIAGAVALLGVAVGVPVATASFGVSGLVAALVGVFAFAAFVATAAAALLRRKLGGWGDAFVSARALASPFGAPRAAEVLLQRIVGDLPSASALQTLMRRDDLDLWLRVHAYDALESGALVAGHGSRGRLEAIVAVVPQDCHPGDRFCPRCAAVFLPHMEECSDCTSVVLRLHGAASESSASFANLPDLALTTETLGSARVPRYVN